MPPCKQFDVADISSETVELVLQPDHNYVISMLLDDPVVVHSEGAQAGFDYIYNLCTF